MKKRKFKFRHILVAVVICYVGYTFICQELMIYRLKNDIAKLNLENSKIEAANAYINDQLQYAGTEGYVEKMARERMGLIKPGEKVYVVGEKEKE